MKCSNNDFISNTFNGEECEAYERHSEIMGDEIHIIHYTTTIARINLNTHKVYIPDKKFSQSTSKLQNLIKREANYRNFQIHDFIPTIISIT